MEKVNTELECILQRLDSIENTIKQNKVEFKPQLTKKECADFFGISINSVLNWCNAGILKPYYVSNRVYFKREDLLEVMFNQNKSA